MAELMIHSQVDLEDGPIPFLHVVAPVGRGISKLGGFLRQPENSLLYVQEEYNDMRDMAAKLLEEGRLHRGDPILYPAQGGAVAARAIADVTGGAIYPLDKDADRRNTVISPQLQQVLAKTPRIVLADDVIHTGGALRRVGRALKDVFHGEITIMANRMLNKSLTKMVTGPRGKPGGLIAEFLPEGATVYTGNIYMGRDNVKISGLVHALSARGFTLDHLAEGYARRAEGEGAGAAGKPAGHAPQGRGDFTARVQPGDRAWLTDDDTHPGGTGQGPGGR